MLDAPALAGFFPGVDLATALQAPRPAALAPAPAVPAAAVPPAAEAAPPAAPASTAPYLLLRAPAATLLSRLSLALLSLGGTTRESKEDAWTLKSKFDTAHGEVSLCATVFGVGEEVGGGLSVCEVRRRRGENLEYAALQARLVEVLADISCLPPR